MAHRELTPATYVIVLAVLLLLTVLTVALSFLPGVHGVWHIVIGLLIAVCKATLVALFFMHLIHSDKVVLVAALAALYWLGILLVLTLSDYFSRNPLLPGH
jgi:cytochrome c oxidase subunit 4